MRKIRTNKTLPVLGRVDKVDLVDLGFENISCKIDTGADTSAIHCHKIRIREEEGKEILVFRLFDPKHPAYIKKDFTTATFTEKRVKNSFGDKEYRYFIKLKIKLFGKPIETEFSLANRSDMKYAILLGKKLLNRHFLVDVSKKNLSYKSKTAPK